MERRPDDQPAPRDVIRRGIGATGSPITDLERYGALMPARIGLLVPFDTSNDRELWRWCPDDASLHITRTGFHEGVVGVPLAEATADLRETAYATRSLKVIGPDVVAFACTSGSFVGGLALERALRETMLANGARRAVTTRGLMLDAFRVARACAGSRSRRRTRPRSASASCGSSRRPASRRSRSRTSGCSTARTSRRCPTR